MWQLCMDVVHCEEIGDHEALCMSREQNIACALT